MAQGQQIERTLRQQLAELTLDELADRLAGDREGGPGTYLYNSAFAEFTRRQTVAQQEAADAQKDAARATKETARYTRQNACYLLASVIVLAVTSLASLAVSIWAALAH